MENKDTFDKAMDEYMGMGYDTEHAVQLANDKAVDEAIQENSAEKVSERLANKAKTPELTVVKRYQNRKLYDTNQSRYVTLEEVGELVEAGQTIQVVDNKTKNDITLLTLFQVVTKREEKKIIEGSPNAMTLEGLNQVIRNG